MKNDEFVGRLNDIARGQRLKLPVLQQGESPSSDQLAAWAKFLEECVKSGISLSDERWQWLSAEPRSSYTRFSLEDTGEPPSDSDFRVGLQLLMGMLEDEDEETS
jgi:hypothetical protein